MWALLQIIRSIDTLSSKGSSLRDVFVVYYSCLELVRDWLPKKILSIVKGSHIQQKKTDRHWGRLWVKGWATQMSDNLCIKILVFFAVVLQKLLNIHFYGLIFAQIFLFLFDCLTVRRLEKVYNFLCVYSMNKTFSVMYNNLF